MKGIRRQLQHHIKQAAPMTPHTLEKILTVVNFNDQKQLVCWVALLFGFHLFLRKSNLVPDTEVHQPKFQLSRADFTYFNNLLKVGVKWAKNLQFGERKLEVPIVRNMNLDICPVYWFLIMVTRVPVAPHHDAFSYWKGCRLVPVTYPMLTAQMRDWLLRAGENDRKFSLHSLRRGGASFAFEQNLPALYTRSRLTRTRFYQIITHFEGHLLHQKSLH